MAALIVYIEVSKELIFSKDKIEHYRDSLYHVWANNKVEFKNSKYGLEVVEHIKRWLDKDNYNQTRTMTNIR